MLDLAGYKENLYGKKILENSFGEGNFLVEIIERYINDCKKHNFSNDDIMNGLSKDIYGFEIDEEIYNRCLDRIRIVLDKNGLKYKKMNLFNDDSLVSHLKEFDYVVGNPPYISYKELNHDERIKLSESFESCKKGKFDYFYAFTEKSINALKTGGCLVYIIPNSIFKTVFGKQLRHIIMNNGLIEVIDNFNEKVFENASVSPSIIKVIKGYNGKIQYIDSRSSEEKSFPREYISSQDKWVFKNGFSPVDKNKSLGNKYTIGNAVATLFNKAFVIKQWVDYNDNYIKVNDHLIEKKLLRVGASPKNLIHNKKELIIFPYQYVNNKLVRYTSEEFSVKFPEGNKYLMQFKKELDERDSDKNSSWFEYGRNQALRNMNKPKLLLSILVTNEMKTFYLDEKVIPYSGIYISINSKEEYAKLKKEIESKRFLDYILSIGVKTEGNSRRITCTDLKNYRLGGN